MIGAKGKLTPAKDTFEFVDPNHESPEMEDFKDNDDMADTNEEAGIKSGDLRSSMLEKSPSLKVNLERIDSARQSTKTTTSFNTGISGSARMSSRNQLGSSKPIGVASTNPSTFTKTPSLYDQAL